jgi:hypothetical protein
VDAGFEGLRPNSPEVAIAGHGKRQDRLSQKEESSAGRYQLPTMLQLVSELSTLRFGEIQVGSPLGNGDRG